MRRTILAAMAAAAVLAAPASAQVGLQPVGRFASPTYVAAPDGDRQRVFVVERRGRIRLVRGGRRLTFLDQRGQTLVKGASGTGDQRGMLSMAFAPDYARSRRFYVFYVDRADRIRVDELRRAAGDPDRADPRTRRTLLAIGRAGPLHHGGQLAFGPDGALYIGIGFGRDERLAQDPASPRGKILRLDVTTPGAQPQVVVLGLRNPYRFSFDAPTRSLLVADVGGDDVEEMTRLPASPAAGTNLGWSVFEGDRRLRPDALPGAVGPTITHRHGPDWCSIVGGFIARDPRVPALRGRYVYGDVCNGGVYAARLPAPGRRLPLRVPYLVSFGVDGRERLYAVSLAGGVWRLVATRR